MGGTKYDDLIELDRRYLRCNDVEGGTRVANAFKALTNPLGQATKNPITCYALHNIFVNRVPSSIQHASDTMKKKYASPIRTSYIRRKLNAYRYKDNSGKRFPKSVKRRTQSAYRQRH